jgi:thiol-disulfide isomerase/thioredoxin
VALVVGIFAVGFPACGKGASASPAPKNPASPRHSTGPGPGDQALAPAAVMDLAAVTQEMRKARGHNLFLHVWASWCGPCLEELPVIDRFARQARARGAIFLSLSLDDVHRAPHVAEVLHRRAPDLTAIVARIDDPDRFISFFSTAWEGAIPALFVYDAAGAPLGSVIGEVDPTTLEQLLAELKTPPPPPPSTAPAAPSAPPAPAAPAARRP